MVDPARAPGEREAAVPPGRPIDLIRPEVLGFYRPGRGWLHALHAWPKLLLLVWAVLAPFALPVWTVGLLLAVFIGAGLSAGLGRTFVRTVVLGALLVGGPVVLLNGLVFPGARDVLIPLGPLAVTREGLEFGLPIAARLVAGLAAVAAFVLSTRPDDLTEGLIERGVGPRLAFALLVAVQAIPRLGRRAAAIVAGARTRALRTSGSISTRAAALRPIVSALAVASLLDVRDRTLALESRGFSSGQPRTAYRTLPWRRVDALTTRLAVLLLVALPVVVALRVARVLTG